MLRPEQHGTRHGFHRYFREEVRSETAKFADDAPLFNVVKLSAKN